MTSRFDGYTVVAAACVILVLVFGVHYSFGIFFKPVLTEFGWTRATTAGAFSLVWIVQGMSSVVMGGLNDRVGPRAVLEVCGLLVGSGFLLMSRIGSVWQLYLFYGVLVGAGLGGTFVPLTSTTARWFVTRRGVATGIVTAGVGLGALFGPPIANRLISIYDWHRSYALLGALVLVGVVLAAQFLKRDPADIGQRPFGDPGPGELATRTSSAGLSFKEALAAKQFWIVSVIFLCYGYGVSTILLHLAPHVTDLGGSAATAAAVLATVGGASVVGKLFMGGAADRIGNKHVYIVSFVLMAVSLIWLMTLEETWALFTFAAVFGFAYGGLAAAHSTLVAWLFGMRQHGLIFGACFNGWTIGCAVGPIVTGYLFDVMRNYRVAFAACAALALLGLLLTTLLSPATKQVGAAAGQIESEREP